MILAFWIMAAYSLGEAHPVRPELTAYFDDPVACETARMEASTTKAPGEFVSLACIRVRRNPCGYAGCRVMTFMPRGEE